MIDFGTWRKGWALLDARERRNAWIVLFVIIVAAFASAVMVGSIMPFLAVLADPSRIESTPILAWAYDTLGFSSVYGFLVALGAASFSIIVFASLLQILRVWAVARFASLRIHSISYRLLESYLAQPYAFFLYRHSGEMGPRILAETGQVVQLFLLPAAELVAAILTTIAVVGLLLWVDPVVTILAFSLLGTLYVGIYAFVRGALKIIGKVRVETNRERFRLASECLSGIKDIKLLGREFSYLDRYAIPSRRMAQTQAKAMVITQVPHPALQAVAFGGVLILCLTLVDPDGISSGAALGGLLPTLGVFAFAGQRLMPELSKIYQAIAQLQTSGAAVDAIYEDLVLGKAPRFLTRKSAEPLGLRKKLRLENVSYIYPNAEKAGIQNLTLAIKAGEKIGVVGSTGAGKTTLADIVLGLLAPSSGQLFADDTPINAENIRSWMQTVGYVPQEIFLTDATISENIALGIAPEAIDHMRVQEAARIARIDTFIGEELPEGYETYIGERGIRLSGGQRQRIGIARALYHDADLIVFDEATSALDNLTEREVMLAIDALPGEKTILMIAHRLSTVKRCDRIIVLEKGRVVGFNTWGELIETNAIFRSLAAQIDGASVTPIKSDG